MGKSHLIYVNLLDQGAKSEADILCQLVFLGSES